MTTLEKLMEAYEKSTITNSEMMKLVPLLIAENERLNEKKSEYVRGLFVERNADDD